MRFFKFVFLLFCISVSSLGWGKVTVEDPYLRINAEATDPLFTTYAATVERSRFFADKAYFLNYFTPDEPITYSSQFAGDWAIFWKVNNIVISKIREFASPPVVTASFHDMAVMEYEPFKGLEVQETFAVYSSGAALVNLEIQNTADRSFTIDLYPLLHLPSDSLTATGYQSGESGLFFEHHEPMERLHSNLYPGYGYPEQFRNLLSSSEALKSYGAYAGCDMQDFYFAIKRQSKVHHYVQRLNERDQRNADIVALQNHLELEPGETKTVRFVRGVQDARHNSGALVKDVDQAMDASVQEMVDTNVDMFKSIPRVDFSGENEKLVYLSAFNLVRQCMLPPRGKTDYNYYVFTRNPIWGWAHGHQVMHESLSMIPYVHLDAESAENSQRIYMEQQYPDGLIGYRHGPRGPQVYPHEGVATTSAPFFSWTNWRVYEVSGNKAFLRDAYQSGTKYIEYLKRERDKDHDGMYEWGPYGIIENVRDGWNAVFQLFSHGEDEGRDISDELDALDLTTQVANEMWYLWKMAEELGLEDEANRLKKEHRKTADLINKHMWDEEDKFYYHIKMSSDSFDFEGESLKRKEIIGFLPMWAHVASEKQAEYLVQHLKNPDTFWRKYGVPTLSAQDPVYTPFVDGCCRWNGPIWLLWDYMVLDGLRNYGYDDEAKQLADKMMLAVSAQLSKNHRFWESYSPDYPVQESPSNYIWDSIMAQVLIDVYKK